jgi:glycosyltransferase involved in cell wall biosynthesis
MKIAIIQDRLRLGGTEAQALALGREWAGAGHEVRLITFRPGGALAETPVAQALKPAVLQPFDSRLDNWAPRLRETVAKLAPDVVVAFGREANAKLPRLRGLASSCLLVATLRSGRDQPERFWRGLRGADRVIANSRWAGEAVRAHGVAPEKTHIIYSGLAREISRDGHATVRADWRQRAGTPADAVVLLCVAGFRPGKGQDELLRVAALLPPEPAWQLWLAGDGPWLNSCKKITRSMKLAGRVRFAGTVKDPAPLYAAADVAVLASEAEALPNFLIEAQAAGLPVVATSVGGVPECFEDGRTGIGVPPGETKAFAAALARAIRDQAWREAAREPAQARTRELFDAARNATRWLEIFADRRGEKSG